MKQLSTAFRLVICSVGFVLVGLAHAYPKIDWLVTPRHAYLVTPASIVTDGTVGHATWSPDGAYLLVSETQPIGNPIDQILNAAPILGPVQRPPNNTGPILLVWDRGARQTRKVWSSEDPNVQMVGVEWLPGSRTAYVTFLGQSSVDGVQSPFWGVMFVNAESGRIGWVPGMEHLPRIPEIVASPLRPAAIAIYDDRPLPTKAEVVAAANAVGAHIEPPPSTSVPVGPYVPPFVDNFVLLGTDGQVLKRTVTAPAEEFGVSWSKDGSKWYETQMNRQTKAILAEELDGNGKTTPVNAELYVPPKRSIPEIGINSRAMVAKQRKTKRGFNNLWLSSVQATDHPDVLLAPSGFQAELSPSEDAVLYVEGGIAKVRMWVALTDEQKLSLFQRLKTEAIISAKQVGLACLMYSADMDDTYPSADGFESLDPYLKDRSLMDDFVYTPPDDLAAAHLQNPAGTELGYVEGPGGRAVTYADGHVKWVPNP